MRLTEKTTKFLKEVSVDPAEINPYLESLESAPIVQKVKIDTVLSRPNVTIAGMMEYLPALQNFYNELEPSVRSCAMEQSEIQVKYEGYIQRERENAEKMTRLENVRLGEQIDYHSIQSLSMEARQKLSKLKPATLGQASRISGISPADISVLMIYLGR
jgi:tRNA uridine 5-carboxymethylaminomethyl modification enzyme